MESVKGLNNLQEKLTDALQGQLCTRYNYTHANLAILMLYKAYDTRGSGDS